MQEVFEHVCSGSSGLAGDLFFRQHWFTPVSALTAQAVRMVRLMGRMVRPIMSHQALSICLSSFLMRLAVSPFHVVALERKYRTTLRPES
jgi:hypothetical protein